VGDVESAAEWGRRQAEAAPPWSDKKWRRICGILRIPLAEAPAGDAFTGSPRTASVTANADVDLEAPDVPSDEDPKLSDRAQQIARVMLGRRHPSGEYVWMTAREIARTAGLAGGTVAQIIARLRGFGWVESRRETGGDQWHRFTGEGATAAAAVLAGGVHHDVHVSTMSALEATEPPAVIAAIRRHMGWGDDNRPVQQPRKRR
jgi:hypothetical protein